MEREITDLIIEETESDCAEEVAIDIFEFEQGLIGRWEHSRRKNKIQSIITDKLKDYGEV